MPSISPVSQADLPCAAHDRTSRSRGVKGITFGWRCSLDATPTKAKEFYLVLGSATLCGLLVNFVGISPIDEHAPRPRVADDGEIHGRIVGCREDQCGAIEVFRPVAIRNPLHRGGNFAQRRAQAGNRPDANHLDRRFLGRGRRIAGRLGVRLRARRERDQRCRYVEREQADKVSDQVIHD